MTGAPVLTAADQQQRGTARDEPGTQEQPPRRRSAGVGKVAVAARPEPSGSGAVVVSLGVGESLGESDGDGLESVGLTLGDGEAVTPATTKSRPPRISPAVVIVVDTVAGPTTSAPAGGSTSAV